MALTQLPDTKERFALGQECRKQMRRVDHRIWKVKDRRESPLALLAASTRGRVPALVALKNQLMADSPFAYFRGAVPVMAYDLSSDREYGNSQPTMWRCARAEPGCVCGAGWTARLRH